MEITTTRRATGAAHDTMPACPHCGSLMVVRAQWHNGNVQGLNWTCRRAPGCEGTRRIRQPDEIRPINHDASTQAIFDWQSSREERLVPRRDPRDPAGSGLTGMLGRMFSRPTTAAPAYEDDSAPHAGAMGYFDGLIEVGFVELEDRGLSAARVAVDHVLVGPSGVFVVERKPWPGHLALSGDSIYVDGRQRLGVTEAILRATDALEQTLAHELKPVGATVRPALLFENATNKTVEASLGNVLVGGTRGLPKLIRGTAEPVLGPETIVRLALAADRLLE
ncbi:MAG: nuclease-related domain-containing protein [Chloroflexota bacterium]